MIRYDRRVWAIAACSSALAGYVDALGFSALGGYFVSFMSGNSTRLSVGLADDPRMSVIAAGLIGSFVAGVIGGTFVGHAAGHRRRPAVLGTVAALLAGAAVLSGFGLTPAAVTLMAGAMGAENAVFQRDGEVSIGLTYMTGTLVKLGQRIASAFLGGDRLAWVPYLLLWLGLILGALIGAVVYAHLKLSGLWAAATAAGVLAYVAARSKPDGNIPAQK